MQHGIYLNGTFVSIKSVLPKFWQPLLFLAQGLLSSQYPFNVCAYCPFCSSLSECMITSFINRRICYDLTLYAKQNMMNLWSYLRPVSAAVKTEQDNDTSNSGTCAFYFH